MKSRVYFAPLPDGAPQSLQVEALRKVYDACGAESLFSEHDFVAVKIHVGEKGNVTHMKPYFIKHLVDRIREKCGYPFLTETSTLYKGERENAVKHLLLAHQNGFGVEEVGAPFIMADGLLGNTECEVEIDGELFKTVKIAGEIVSADSLFAVAHATGHIAVGFGASVKTLGMGLASRKGKLRQHSAMRPEIDRSLCRLCKKCMQWCPQAAVIEEEGKAFIIKDRCIGCGECLAVCRFDAVKFDFAAESGFMQKSMAEHALGAIKNKMKRSCFFNLMVDMTKDCDCFGVAAEKIIPDIGILASFDPVAVDMAALDLSAKAHGKTLAEMSYESQNALIQFEHGQKIGLGSMDYELVTLPTS